MTRTWVVSVSVLALAVMLVFLTTSSEPDDLRDGLRDGVARLPAELRELSGMVAIDASTLACVQDELGTVFFVDLTGRRPMRRVPFGRKGDYEGIAVTEHGLWTLLSTGVLLHLAWRGEGLVIRDTYRLPFEGDYEGLCLDAKHDRLLVLPKGPVGGKRRERDRRRIYAFDLRERVMLKEPVVTLSVQRLVSQIETRDLAAPRRTTRKGKRRVELRLRGSELLVLAGGDILLLSPKDHLLLRIGPAGALISTQEIDAQLLPQPEAMALLPDGRLLIGSEGVDGPAVIAVIELLP